MKGRILPQDYNILKSYKDDSHCSPFFSLSINVSFIYSKLR